MTATSMSPLRNIRLGVVLAFVGVKTLLGHTEYKIDTLLSLGIVVLVIATSIIVSVLRPKRAVGHAPV